MNKSARRRSREFALQALYQWQLAGHAPADLERQYREADGFASADAGLFLGVVGGVIRNAPALEALLTPHIDRAFAELSPIERAILLIGAYELAEMPETPYRVILNESIELAKSFGGTDGHKYVNGVLDKLAPQARPQEVAAPRATASRPRVSVKARRKTAT
ncbi:MAG TPA: transcription antitermination factor NusB [Usitatibacteraceae bacterium]|nr:transcription antitermination factor NusB [Usitatibacteraceae bacterium]